MSWGIVAAAGGAIVGGLIASDGAQSAADTQADAAREASAEAARQYDQTRQDQAPWMDAGRSALTQLTAGTQAGGQFMKPFTMADYEADPGYQFRLDQGTQAIERSAAARGGLLSGAAAKALTKYSQGVASDEYGNAYNRYTSQQTNNYNRLASLAGVGQTAANTVANVGQSTTQAVQNNLIGAGNARASGYVGTANAINNGIGQAYNMYQNNRLMGMLGGGGFMANSSGSGSNPYAGYDAAANGGWGIE